MPKIVNKYKDLPKCLRPIFEKQNTNPILMEEFYNRCIDILLDDYNLRHKKNNLAMGRKML